jgi:hypothetical protein
MIRLLALCLLPLPLQGCFFVCGSDEIGRTASPGGQYVATVFVRNCGATTDFNTNIAIVATGESVPKHGNTSSRKGAPRRGRRAAGSP